MPLLRVKRHMAAISSRQAWRGLAQLHPLRQAGLPQWVDGAEEAVGERLALTAGAVFFEQQVTEPLFEAVDEFQHRVAGQIGRQTGLLLGGEVVAMAAHEREQAAVLTRHRIPFLPPRWRADKAESLGAAGGTSAHIPDTLIWGLPPPGSGAANPSLRGAPGGAPTPCCATASPGSGRRIWARYTGPRFSGFPLLFECRYLKVGQT